MFKKSIRTQVPRFSGARLNRAHPLGAIAESVWYPADLSGIAAGSNIRTAPHADVRLIPRDGRPAFYNNDANEVGSTTAIVARRFPWVQFALWYIDAVPGFVATQPSQLTGSFAYSLIQCGSSTVVTAAIRFGGTARSADITLTGGTLSKLLATVLLVKSETEQILYCNGQSATNTSSPGTQPDLIQNAASPLGTMNGSVLLSGYGQGMVPDGYALWLSQNPDAWYEMFEPRRIWMPVPTAAPSGFLPAWIRRPQRTIGAGVI